MNSTYTSKEGNEGPPNAKRKRSSKPNHNSNSSSNSTPPTNNNTSSNPKPHKKHKTSSHHSTKPALVPSKTASNNTTSPSTEFSTHPTAPSLEATHTITNINIISSTSIQKKVTQTLNALASADQKTVASNSKVEMTDGDSKPALVVLTAKSPVGTKLITIVEIAKREIGAQAGKWFQYCAVGESLQVQAPIEARNGKSKGKGGNREGNDEGSEEEEEAFEEMKTPFERAIEGKEKVRTVPLLTIYLARVRVEGLRRIYGEQTNAVSKPE